MIDENGYTVQWTDVAENTVAADIDVVLELGGSISGMVVDALAGTPLADVDVRIYRTGSSALDVAATDGLGRFHTYVGLDTGEYFAVARPDFRDPHLPETWDDLPDAAEPWHGTPIPVVVGAVTTGIDFGLDRGGTVSGTVVESSAAQPVAGVRLRISKFEDSLNDWTDTDSLGRYEFNGLPPGTYFVTTDRVPVPFLRELFDNIPCEPHCDPETGTPIPVTANGTSPGIDFTLSRGGLLAGRVVNALTGEPLSGVLMTIDGPGYYDTQYTSGDGGYSTTGLLPGQYFISAIRSGFHGQRYDGLSCEDSCDRHLATPTDIAWAQIEIRDFALYPSGQDPDLHISFEHLCGGSFTSCGEITLGPGLQLVCSPEFTARDRVSLLGEVSIGAGGAKIGTDPGLTCP